MPTTRHGQLTIQMLGFCLVVTLLTSLVPVAAVAQISPLGDKFRVNTTTTGDQASPAVTTTSDGGFVVVWSGPDGEDSGVFGRRFDAGGSPAGAEFRINSYTSGRQSAPSVAPTPGGGFVVVWTPSAAAFNLLGRRFDGQGDPIAVEFQVGQGFDLSENPTVASGSDGRFVVAWDVDHLSEFSVDARRFDANALPLGGTISVSDEGATAIGARPQVATDIDGNFIVSWRGTFNDIAARAYDDDGQPSGDEFELNTTPIGARGPVALDANPNGDAVAVWWGGPSKMPDAIFGQRLTVSGFKTGGELTIRSNIGSSSNDVALAADGRFMVSWLDTGTYRVVGRRFTADGDSLGMPFTINSSTVAADPMRLVRLDSDPEGDMIVVWEEPDEDGRGIYARRYLGEVPGVHQKGTLDNPVPSDPQVASFVADNFRLQEPGTINQLSFCGGYSPANVPFEDDVSVRVLTEEATLPGSVLADFPGLAVSRKATGRAGVLTEYCYDLTLPEPVALPGGIYWLEISNDSGGSPQTWAWLSGDGDPVAGQVSAAASSDGSSWSISESDRALEIPFRTFATANATFFWGEALWRQAADKIELFDTTHQNVSFANEVVGPPVANFIASDVLTFEETNTGLSRSFTVTQLEQVGSGWIYNDPDLIRSRFELSPNGNFFGSDDDVEISILDGPPLTAFGMTIVEEGGGSAPGLQSLDVYGPDGELLESLDLARVSFGRSWTFLGVVTKRPITRIVFDEDSAGDDIGVQHFRFGVNAAPIFADGFESGDITAWSATTP